jgi:cell wall assembly regulator SMI1
LAQLEDELKAKAPEVLTNLQPGLSMDKIDELEKQSGVQIPDDLKAVYHWRNGYSRAALELSKFQASGPMPGHYFVPLDEALEMSRGLSNQVAGTTPVQRTAFNALVGFTKTWITLFDDGSGDGYFYDPKREPVEGAIFYHDMEDTGYTFFPSPKNLFAGMVKCYQQNIFVRKEGTNGASLDEDFEAAEKIWKEFGVESAQN